MTDIDYELERGVSALRAMAGLFDSARPETFHVDPDDLHHLTNLIQEHLEGVQEMREEEQLEVRQVAEQLKQFRDRRAELLQGRRSQKAMDEVRIALRDGGGPGRFGQIIEKTRAEVREKEEFEAAVQAELAKLEKAS